MKKYKRRKAESDPTESISTESPRFVLNQRWLLIYLAASALMCYVMDYLYPTLFANADTLRYIDCAIAQKLDVYRPFGYSQVILLMRSISAYSQSIFQLQYWTHILSSLFFCFSLSYFFPAKNRIQSSVFHLVTTAIFFAPGVLILSNYLISDSLFLSTSLCWITSLMWFMHSRKLMWFGINLLAMFASIKLRYTGLLYPLFSSIAAVYCYRKQIQVLIALLPAIIVWYVITSTQSEMMLNFHVRLFSPFSGWQSANNAIQITPYIDLDPATIKDPEVRHLHYIAQATPDSVYAAQGTSVAYMWDNNLPLKKYFLDYLDRKNYTYLKGWAHVSPIFSDYGHLLMIKYPFIYLQHFILPNARMAFFPYHAEELEQPVVLNKENRWFVEKDQEYLPPRFDPFHRYLVPVYPYICLTGWILLCVFAIHLCFARKRLMKETNSYIHLICWGAFLLVYLGFHIYAAPVAIRYLLVLQPLQWAVCYVWSGLLFRGKE